MGFCQGNKYLYFQQNYTKMYSLNENLCNLILAAYMSIQNKAKTLLVCFSLFVSQQANMETSIFEASNSIIQKVAVCKTEF